ncbi:40S ribosomal protein S8 [Platanthera zijinensis]|uniref:40S ribosomal protein S8 n=1 Tax=Platanthera zijinensis TaxID=2320716 RepID=A0AAP0BGB1_9ASPA
MEVSVLQSPGRRERREREAATESPAVARSARPSKREGDTATMGISRDSLHKRRATGGKKKAWRKKRKYELGRQPANTKLSSNKTVRRVRVRGGNVKWRALRLDTGNYSWGSEAITRKTRILDVVYNASNNELVRTQTLVKSAIIQVDAAPFKQWYLQHYGVELGKKKKAPAAAAKKDAPEVRQGIWHTGLASTRQRGGRVTPDTCLVQTLGVPDEVVFSHFDVASNLINPPWSLRSRLWLLKSQVVREFFSAKGANATMRTKEWTRR